MIITQENIEKLNVGDYPGARLCKGLLLDAIEAGDKLEARVNELERENAKLRCLVLHLMWYCMRWFNGELYVHRDGFIGTNAIKRKQLDGLTIKYHEAYRKAKSELREAKKK